MNGKQDGAASYDKAASYQKFDWYKLFRYVAVTIIVGGSVFIGKKAWELLDIEINSNGYWDWPEVAVYFITVAGGLAFLVIVLQFVVSLVKIDEY